MSTKKKPFIYSIIIGLSFLLLSASIAFPRIAQNGSGQGYDDGSDSTGEKAAVQTGTIEMYIVQGGGYFLKAHAAVQELLNRVEWQDIRTVNYDELNRLAGSALYNITVARCYYWQLVAQAEVTPYNPEVIERLKYFDYDSFMKVNNLNPATWERVRAYLAKGDITGSFKYFLGNIMTLEHLLISVQSDLFLKKLPGLETAWKLNEVCAETALYGSYAARIFNSK